MEVPSTHPVLLLRKPPSTNGTKAKHLKPIVKRRLDQHDAGDWKTLLEEYESDVVRSQLIHRVDTRTEDDKDMAAIRKAADLLARFQCSKARKHLQSNGLGDHTDENIIEHMTHNHPARKKPITPLSNEDLEKPRRGISRELFAKQIAGLKHDVASGLGCLQNEHLLAILLNPNRQMNPSAAQVVDNFYDYADAGCMQSDLRNGYNDVMREGVLVNIKDSGKLDDTLAFSHALLLPEAYVGMGNGTSLATAPFRCAEGVHQGAIEAGWFFAIAVNPPAFQRLNNRLREHGGGVVPSLMTIIFLAHQSKYLLQMMHLLLILLKLDSLPNQANQSAISMMTIALPTGMNFEATYQTALSRMTLAMYIMVSQSVISLLDLTL